MKGLCMAFGLMLSSGTAFPDSEFVIRNCNDVYDFAKGVMTDRQNSYPLPNLLREVGQLVTDPKSKIITLQMIDDSYKRPRYVRDATRKREIEEFASQQMINCMRNGL